MSASTVAAPSALNTLAAAALRGAEQGIVPREITAKSVYGAVVEHLTTNPNYCPEMDARLALLRDAIRHMASFARHRRWRPSPDAVAMVQVILGRWEELGDGE